MRPAIAATLLGQAAERLGRKRPSAEAEAAAALAAALATLRPGDAPIAANTLSAAATRALIRAHTSKGAEARLHQRTAERLSRVAGVAYALAGADASAFAEPLQVALFPTDAEPSP